MHVLATAGHVDHGKSTLVTTLTGRDPDRLAEEKRRGLTIDLGYAWTTLAAPDGYGGDGGDEDGRDGHMGDGDEVVAFVDVPGHERFIATMLAGLGPTPAVLFVVAADEGWREQSAEHLAAVHALRLRHGLLVITRADRADPARALSEATAAIERSSLGRVPSVVASGLTGAGIPELRRELFALVRRLPPPRAEGPVRLWIDRSFVIKGAGTVVTGTLDAGGLRVGDELVVGDRRVVVRGLQSLERTSSAVVAPARVAVNLRGIAVDAVHRGDPLCTPGQWNTTELDVVVDRPEGGWPPQLTVHLGTASLPARVRPLGPIGNGWGVRLRLDRPLPVRVGDRLVLRDPGGAIGITGAAVVDIDPPELRRRGAARRRAETLERLTDAPKAEVLAEQVRVRGAARRSDLTRRGVEVTDTGLVQVVDDWLVDPDAWTGWQGAVQTAVERRAAEQPLDPRVAVGDLQHQLRIPDPALVVAASIAVGLRVLDGRVQSTETAADLGTAEAGIRRLEDQLREHPYDAPDREALRAWRLGVSELAAAERVGRVVRLAPDLVLLPDGPALALRTLARLPQPFTTSQARVALVTTRRVAIPLLEYLDGRGWTRRLDGDHREVRESIAV